VNSDPEQLRRYLAAAAVALRKEPDREKVRFAAGKLAMTIDEDDRFKITQWVDAMPIDVFADPEDPHSIRWLAGGEPLVQRDERISFVVEKLLDRAEAAIRTLEDYQAGVAANASLSFDERRELVLRTIALIDERNGGDKISATDVRWESKLSQAHVDDALEHWHECEAIRYGLVTADEMGRPLIFRLTARGRERNEKGPPRPSPTSLIQQFHQSQIGSAITLGDVTQNITVNPDVADVVAALLRLQRAAEVGPETAAVAVLARDAQQELRSQGWSAKAAALLSGLGGLVQTTASLKPAYQTLQPIAVAHGVPLPTWQ
jgi:hypothetical protein